MVNGAGVGSYKIVSGGTEIEGISGGDFIGSDYKFFTIGDNLSTYDFQSNKVGLYPNPSSPEGVISLETTEPINVTIFDILGKLVFTKDNA